MPATVLTSILHILHIFHILKPGHLGFIIHDTFPFIASLSIELSKLVVVHHEYKYRY